MTYLKFVNQGGFPTLQSTGNSTNGTITTFSFNDHPYRQTNRFLGGFWIKIPDNTTTLTQTNTVQFDTVGIGGSAVPVYKRNGNQALVSDLASTGPSIHLCFYDRDNNRVQIII